MALPRRVVITGIGVISPIGLDAGSFWDALTKGRSGIATLPEFDLPFVPVRFGAAVRGFDPKKYLEKKERKRLGIMVRSMQFAAAAAQLAVEDGLLDKSKIDPTRFGTIFGSSTLPSELKDLGRAALISANRQTHQVLMEAWGVHGLPLIPPMWMLEHVPNMSACHVSIFHDTRGPSNSITESDAASLLALAEAHRWLRRGAADLFLVGGGDTKLVPINFARQILFSPLSHRNDAPDKACRPFDRDRDGIVLGEGAGVLLVEELEHAQRRQARIYAEVVGVGAAFDRGLTGQGLARAIRLAMNQAGVEPDAIDHINAQGYSIPREDAGEARAYLKVFGLNTPPVLAVKSYVGQLGGAAAAVELAASLLALQHQHLPATLNYVFPDPACPINVARLPQPTRLRHFLKVSFTEMGQCAAVVCRRWEG